MANIFARALSGISSLFRTKSSKGEKFIMSGLPGIAGVRSPFTWSTNRLELANHFTGWPYVAINAKAETIAGIAPHAAYRHDAQSVAREKAAAFQTKGAGRREAVEAFRRKYLAPHIRAKALTPLQPNEELEPVSHNHPLLKLWHKPNPYDTAWTLSYKLDMFLGLHGSAYLWAVPSKYGSDEPPAELHVLPSQWVWPVPGKDTFVSDYEIRPVAGYAPSEQGIGWFAGGGGLLRLPANQIIAIQKPNPLNPFDGWSPLMAIGAWVQVGESMDNSRIAHFANGAFPGVAVEIDKEVVDPDEAMIERIKVTIKNKYAGVRNNKEPVVLGPGVKLVPFTTAPLDMDYTNGSEQIMGWVLAAYKTSSSVVGMAEMNSYAAMVASRANYHELAIRPDLVFRGQVLTEKLASRYDERLVMYWPDSVPNDPAHELAKWSAAMEKQAATPNEFRTHVLQLEPFSEGGDMPIAPLGVSEMQLGMDGSSDDLLIPALAAQQQQADQEKAEGALDAGEGRLETAEVKADELPEKPKPEKGPGEAARNRLRSMSAMQNLNGSANGKPH